MKDLIDRAKAIDAVTAWLNKALNPLNQSKYTEGEIAAYETALSELKKIPSAQPEIVRCKDCRYWDVYPSSSATPWLHKCYVRIARPHTAADDFCSRANRREVSE